MTQKFGAIHTALRLLSEDADYYYKDMLTAFDERKEDGRIYDRDQAFAAYGYFAAFHEMGYITLEQLNALVKRLPLTLEDLRKIETLP
jgi:hypothetical protein